MIRSYVTIVTGLPRSGTSMMMRMLKYGGMEILTDERRPPDDDNPEGYFEYEPVKQTATDPSWVLAAQGKAVKVIYRYIPALPPDFEYRIIFMHRKIQEIISSQKKMLARRGEIGANVSDDQMAFAFMQKIKDIEKWIQKQPHMHVLKISYNTLIKNPKRFLRPLNSFLGNQLNIDKMTTVVDDKLYRNRF